MKTAGRSGHQRKTITVTTNDPRNEKIYLKIEADVIVPYDVSPAYLNFQTVKLGEVKKAEVTVTNRTEKTIVLGEPRVPSPDLKVYMEKNELKPGEAMTFGGDYHPTDANRKVLSGYVAIPVIEGAAGEKAEVIVRVFGRVDLASPPQKQ